MLPVSVPSPSPSSKQQDGREFEKYQYEKQYRTHLTNMFIKVTAWKPLPEHSPTSNYEKAHFGRKSQKEDRDHPTDSQ